MAWRARRVSYATVRTLSDALDIPEALAWTLARRGLDTPDTAGEFIHADGPLAPPEALDGIAPIAERLLDAVAAGRTIAIHGDYDCDGVCATATLAGPLRGLGASVLTFLPSRFSDGYGVRIETVERLADEGASILICVDCGTSAVDALARAAELGLEPIVLDHHLAGGQRPPGLIANPALGIAPPDAPAAAGVVFAVVRALAARTGADLLGIDPDDQLDLVALATIADAVPLVGDNRRLVIRGLERMRRSPRPGIVALCRAAGTDPRTLDARALAFTLAPVINAAGRLEHPDRALALLMEDDLARAGVIADELWSVNAARRDVEQGITAEAIAQIEASPSEIRDANAIIAIGDGWHEGVIGIVASRLVEHFDRPALVLTRDQEIAKGSGRSLPDLDLHDLLGRASTRLTRWGGHAGAVGLQLPAREVAAFRDEFLAAAAGLADTLARARVRPVDAVVGARELTLATAEAFEALAPFGRGNPQPRLVMPACTTEAAGTMGKDRRHLNVRLHCGGAHLRAVGFGLGHRVGALADGTRVDVQVRLGIERFQGIVGPRVTIDQIDAVIPGPDAVSCASACDLRCAARRGLADIRSRLAADQDPVRSIAGGSPRGIMDQRGLGVGLVRIAALAGADAGVVVVVGDVPRRRSVLADALHPDRIGVELATLAGVRCAPAGAAERLALAGRRAGIVVADYAALGEYALPGDTHLVVLDPPAEPAHIAALQTRSADRWVHLVWTAHEVAFMRALTDERWDLDPLARSLWPSLEAGGTWAWDPTLEAVLLGDASAIRHPAAVADVLAAFVELGLAEVSDDGLTVARRSEQRPFAQAPRALQAAERRAAAHAFLDLAPTVDPFRLGHDAGSPPAAIAGADQRSTV